MKAKTQQIVKWLQGQQTIFESTTKDKRPGEAAEIIQRYDEALRRLLGVMHDLERDDETRAAVAEARRLL